MSELQQAPKAPLEFTSRGGGYAMQPRNLEEAWRMAQIFAKSTMVPPQFRNSPEDIIVATQYGAEVGLSWTSSLSWICVIKGRPSLWGRGAAGVISAHPDCEHFEISHTGDFEEGTLTAHCTIKRRGRNPVTASFSWEQAKRAGLDKKDTYKAYPHDMLGWKALHRASNTTFGDALCGLSIAEDVMDIPREPRNVTPRTALPPGSGPNDDILAMRPQPKAEPDEATPGDNGKPRPTTNVGEDFKPSIVHRVGGALGLDEKERRAAIKSVTGRASAQSVTREQWPAVKAEMERVALEKAEQPPPPDDGMLPGHSEHDPAMPPEDAA
jgi:hypothetical protein